MELIISARARVVKARRDVIDWMNAEGAAGRLRTNEQAPGWPAYIDAEDAWAAILRDIDAAVSP